MTAQVLVSPEALAGDDVSVADDAYRHLFRARRLAQGDALRVVDGAGHARWGRVAEVGRASARVDLEGPAPSNEADYWLELVVTMPRRERASWLVEKVTELGASAIRWVQTERSPRQPGSGTLERLSRVSVAALEQSGRSRLPQITGPHSWEELPALLDAAEDRWWLDAQPPQEDGSGLGLDDQAVAGWQPSAGPGRVVIGPEGGWSADERQTLGNLGCRPIWLGPRVLRVETAAIVAVAAILADPSHPK